jgi:nucleoside-triphosphatase THEP1
LEGNAVRGRIILISGQRGGGKTTVCRRTAAGALAAGYECGGLLTIVDGDTGTRTAVDVRTGDTRQLTASGDGIRHGRFVFDREALKWGARVLAQSVPCQLLIVDEIGPLELERGEGWSVALDVLRMGRFELALAVVRPELVHKVQLRLPASAPTVVTVTPENRDDLPRELVDMLKRGA